MSSRANRTAKAYWRSPASTAIGTLNAKSLPDDAVVWARAVTSTASRKAKAFVVQVNIKIALGSKVNREAEEYRRSHTSTAKNLLDDTAVTPRAVISCEPQSKSIYGPAVYQHRVEHRPERQSAESSRAAASMAHLYIKLALSSKANSNAEAY